jgi:hypothetical protein
MDREAGSNLSEQSVLYPLKVPASVSNGTWALKGSGEDKGEKKNNLAKKASELLCATNYL